VSPILTRPVREQLEHDRVIRQLQARYKRKHDVVINPGSEQNQSVTVGQLAVFPDLLLFSQERSRRLQGTVEVETGESVNQLEALAEWGVFGKLKVPLHLYVPPQALDTARRLCTEHQIELAELWTYLVAIDQVRFTMIYRAPEATPARSKAPSVPSVKKSAKRVVKAPAKTKARAKATAKLKPKNKAKAKSSRPAPQKAAPKKVASKKPSSTKKSKSSRRR
jgi:hypothetical protein